MKKTWQEKYYALWNKPDLDGVHLIEDICKFIEKTIKEEIKENNFWIYKSVNKTLKDNNIPIQLFPPVDFDYDKCVKKHK